MIYDLIDLGLRRLSNSNSVSRIYYDKGINLPVKLDKYLYVFSSSVRLSYRIKVNQDSK